MTRNQGTSSLLLMNAVLEYPPAQVPCSPCEGRRSASLREDGSVAAHPGAACAGQGVQLSPSGWMLSFFFFFTSPV